ncbi:FecR domain-containing protein [Pseudomonas paraeruginosa]|uniref:FecR domain-containing protein n=1 Tax=Pseudomonas aeruginosa TaxID=287 RepID=UPI000D1B7CB6|nr:FecR family protein [Pseudomonas aeruginosa]
MEAMRGRVDEALVRQAIRWLVRLRSQPDDGRLQRACAAWRAEHGEHERAWQQVSALSEELHGRFKALPGGVACGTLDSSAQRLQRRQALKLLSLLVAGAVAWVGRDSLPWQRLSADYSTATGERRSIELADGTRLQLNTDSAVDVRYDAGQRLILLARGEIFLSSGADAQSPRHRPLRVRTAQGLFEALGTRFNVRLHDAATCLSVSAGAVRIEAFGARPAQAPVAEAGQSYRIAADGVRRLQRPPMDAAAWADGLIVTRDMRLADFLAEVGRYRNGYLGCAAEVADLRLSGVYRLDDSDRLLQVLARTLPVRLQRHTRWWVRVVAA